MADVLKMASVAKERFTTNLAKSFEGMSPTHWIRVVAFVGAYLLLRPYLMKLGAKVQTSQLEKEAAQSAAAAEEKEKAKKQRAAMSPNDLRGGRKAIPAEESDSEDEQVPAGQASGADWGKKARKRQKVMIKKLLSAEEERLQKLQEDDEDKDIEEFLTG